MLSSGAYTVSASRNVELHLEVYRQSSTGRRPPLLKVKVTLPAAAQSARPINLPFGSNPLVDLPVDLTSAVNDHFLSYAQTNGVDIALLQEPYTHRGKLSGLEARPLMRILSVGANPLSKKRQTIFVVHVLCI